MLCASSTPRGAREEAEQWRRSDTHKAEHGRIEAERRRRGRRRGTPSASSTTRMLLGSAMLAALSFKPTDVASAFVLPPSSLSSSLPRRLHDAATRMSAASGGRGGEGGEPVYITTSTTSPPTSTTSSSSSSSMRARNFDGDDRRRIGMRNRVPLAYRSSSSPPPSQAPPPAEAAAAASTFGQQLLRALPKAAMLVLGGGWLGGGGGGGGGGLLGGEGGRPYAARAEDELAQYAKEGNKVGVDAKCFVQKCSLPTHDCLNNPDCLKGLSCLSKCKGEGTCSTACFAKYGNGVLDDFLHCAVEQQDCVHVPRDRSRATWTDPDTVGLDKQSSPSFEIGSLEGRWYKVMGMDARYDCFDCQVNHFTRKPGAGAENTMVADVSFRMPRPRAPGFWENHITEELLGDGPGARRSMHSVGRMFGLTFWENWYVIGENDNPVGEEGGKEGKEGKLPAYKFVYYTGHTLQGNYEGAFVYARTPELPPELMPAVSQVARANGLDPTKFCKIRNTCFRPDAPLVAGATTAGADGMKLATAAGATPPISSLAGMKAWVTARALWLPQQVSKLTAAVNRELDDWFEDPTTTSDWLIKQQERMIMVTDTEEQERAPREHEPRGGAVQVIATTSPPTEGGGGRGGNGGGSGRNGAKSKGKAKENGKVVAAVADRAAAVAATTAAAASAATAQLDGGPGGGSSSNGGGGGGGAALPPAFVDYLAKKSP